MHFVVRANFDYGREVVKKNYEKEKLKLPYKRYQLKRMTSEYVKIFIFLIALNHYLINIQNNIDLDSWLKGDLTITKYVPPVEE